MISRVGLTAARRVAAKPSATFFSANLLRASAVSSLPAIQQTRGAATQKLTETDAQELLASQRRQRPTSPHLSIYAKDQTWFTASIWTRITGGIFSGGLYAYATAYLAAPLLGWHLESASIAAAVGALPFAIKGGLKFLIAWPFVFHLFNGIRHLVMDVGIGFTKKTLKTQGWAIWGASLLGGLYLGFIW
ncbi:putative succinate dehydrogenase cytochrome b subunit protein [Phaeoacremonium minimum UCRPA7]|uniref:Putative succinate dehydrogenase cytochrome b subunit protein n=1 Tax=Phaeoacremonium minimum (strain UCR-PA7) TaxID=1286976 RepID=R8BNT9_PHAM7|nr:putative succinate dehydrogenase cytochrome b subunit protein [Phaeoacremonium minimum UCRPA7]EOO00945.1 putative succinate dehydrogenase cytochrome b subunit protein [Phaeoacremonium minimum UCRPA7]